MENKVSIYRKLFKKSEGRRVWIRYRRAKHMMEKGYRYYDWNISCRVIKVNKNSIIVLMNDEYKVSIGYRNIRECMFLSSTLRIKHRLYYEIRD